MTTPLRICALLFAALALAAGGLQVWAYVDTGVLRHAIVGGFALAVGCCVVWAALRRSG